MNPSVLRMRQMTEEAQQTLPKSIDNDPNLVLAAVDAAGAGLVQKMRPMDFGKLEKQEANVQAVLQHMHMRQMALNNQQAAAQSQVLSDAQGSVHALSRPLTHAAIARHHAEMRGLVRGMGDGALVANADLARRMRGFDIPHFHIGTEPSDFRV